MGGRCTKRVSTAQHLVQHDGERPDVPRRLWSAASNLFRRHVAGRADDGTRRGERARLRRFVKRLRDPEIQHFRDVVGDEKDVVGLQVAMNELTAMRRIDGVTDAVRDLQHARRRETAVAPHLSRRVAPINRSMTR